LVLIGYPISARFTSIRLLGYEHAAPQKASGARPMAAFGQNAVAIPSRAQLSGDVKRRD
jgi:hypothetical protein